MAKTLEEFKLYYEEMEFHKVKKTPTTKVATKKAKYVVKKRTQSTIIKERITHIKDFTTAKLIVLKINFSNVVNKALHPSKTAKKMTKIEQKAVIQQRKNGIMGIGLLFVIVSIIYSTYVVRTFVDTGLSFLALTPQVVFATYILIKAFSKLYK